MALSEDLLWLCRIPSITGQERALCDALIERLSASPGLPSPIRRYGDSLVVPLSRGTGGPKLALVGQLDVCETGQQELNVVGDRVIAPGAADMKSGLSLMLAVAQAPPTRADVTLVLHARGELGFDGSELGAVVERDAELRQLDLALVLKPTDNKLQLGSGGSTQATVGFRGRPAHSGLPGTGPNAIHRFATFLSKITGFSAEPDVVDGLTWYQTLNVTSAHGGRGGSIVPGNFEVNVHHAYGPSTDTHKSQDLLLALVERTAAVRFEELSEPAAPNRSHPLIQRLQESGVRGVEARQTWTEVARFTALGIAAANFGPGPERAAHSRDEFADIGEIEAAHAILTRFLQHV